MTKNEMFEKLPLLVNGQLDETECVELEKAIKNDPELAAEAEFLKVVGEGIKHQDVPLPGDIGLMRLQRDIQHEMQQNKKQQPVEQETEKQQASVVAGPKPYWKPVAIAACCLLALQTMMSVPWQATKYPVDIAPLAGQSVEQGQKIQVVFADTATSVDILDALSAIGATIVGGPGALGIFIVALPAGSETSQALEKLEGFEAIDEVFAF